MNSSQSSLSGKLNPSSASFSPPPQQQQPTQTIAPGPEFFTRRSSNQSNQAANLASARNNQAQKKKHKKSRRPGLGSSNLDADDAFAEASLMRTSTAGRRGQTSITHLMNISLPPRPQAQFHTPRPGNGGSRGYARSGIGSGYHAEDKARYIHANYRFIVHPNPPPTATNAAVSYRPQSMDPDVPLDWNNVLQILVSSESQSSSCPICLSKPVAPRMAKCGHIFCLPCLIRYMHVDDSDPKDAKPGTLVPVKRPKYKKCPLCWDSIYMSDTRPVRWFAGQENPAPREGEDVILRLVMRYPGSTLALPREDAEALGQMEDIPWWFAPEVTDYARVMKGTEEYMVEQYDAEIASLREQEKEDELMFGDETTWTKKAVRAIIEAKEQIVGIGNAPEQHVKKGKKPAPVEVKQVDEKNIIDESPATTWTKIHSGELDPSTPTAAAATKPDAPEPAEPPKMTIEDGINHLSITAKDSAPTLTIPGPRTRRISGNHQQAHAPYYFYQSLPHYYLAPLDIRILKAAYGDFTHLPSTLLPRVEHVSTGHAVDDELRKRTKYLAHLPYGGEVSFLECNWTDVVPDNVLSQFAKEVQSRRAKRNEKENREEKARVRAEKLEDEERWGRRRKETFAGEIEEERFGADDFVPLPSHTESSEGGEGRSPPYATDSRPGFGSLSEDGQAAEIRRQQSVWGTTVLAAQEEEYAQQHGDGNDGWLLDWEKELKMENEAIAAAQAASLAEEGGAGSSMAAGPVPSSGQGKKKKKQKITLMSTTARRAA